MAIFRMIRENWRQPAVLIFLLSGCMALSISTYSALLNNYVVENIGFTGIEIGFLHTLREIPGLLAFGVIFILLIIREQRFGYLTLILLGIGTAYAGLTVELINFYMATVIASFGFHYFDTVRQSLTLQWISKEDAPVVMGQTVAVNAFVGLGTFGIIFVVLKAGILDMGNVLVITGAATVVIALLAWAAYPAYAEKVVQTKKLVLRQRYWLYYLLTFLAGARRQIVGVFAAFLMVEKFGFGAAAVTAMLLANHLINMFLAPRIGKLIARWGERRALVLEYVGLICVFTAYAFVSVAWLAVSLFILDHVFYALAIAMRTYFQKIADPADMANTAAVSFTINHIAAVVLPAILGVVWITSHSAVFLIGAGIAACSLACALLIPRHPAPGNEVIIAGLCSPQAAE